MPNVFAERMIPVIEGDFVVFLIGMRINKPWKVHKWWPVASAMPKMLRELRQHPDLGLLGFFSSSRVIVQYWRSFAHLEAYAKSREHLHLPAWKAFNQAVGRSRGDVGIWHETYLIDPGRYECVYANMPRHGLGHVMEHVPAAGRRHTAAERLRPAVDVIPM